MRIYIINADELIVTREVPAVSGENDIILLTNLVPPLCEVGRFTGSHVSLTP